MIAVGAVTLQTALDLVIYFTRDELFELTFGHGLAGIVLVYAMCRWAPARQAAVGLGVVMALAFITELLDGESLITNLLLVVPWLIPALLAVIARYRSRLREAQQDQVRLAERNTLARELHDTVAHYVSAIAVQAQAAQFVGKSDPDAMLSSVKTIEETANTAIDEMRRMIGILRSADDQDLTVLAGSLNELAQPDGRPRVNVEGDTDLTSVPAPIAAALYRLAQESITNAVRHNDDVTFVDVTVAVGEANATIEVINDGRPSTRNRGSGYGLVGMNERVEALGGTMSYGPRPTSGWRMAATLPMRRVT